MLGKVVRRMKSKHCGAGLALSLMDLRIWMSTYVCPSCYPPGAYDTLKVLRDEAAQRLAERTTADAGPNRQRRRHMPAFAELKRRRLAERTNRAHAGGAIVENAGTRAGTLADILRRRKVVEDLRGLGLSIRGIAAATGIPRSSVHRAVRAMARARAKQEADTIEIMNKLLGKKLSR